MRRPDLGNAFDPAVEKLHLITPDGGPGILPVIDTCKLDRHVMRPRPNQDMLPARPGLRRLFERAKGFEVALNVIVVPAAHRKHRDVYMHDLLSHAELLPKAVVRRMVQRLLVERDGLPGSRPVGRAQRQMRDEIPETWPL